MDAESELYNSRTSLINIEYTALNNYYDLMFNLSQLTDTVLSSENQICDNVSPRVFSYTPKEQDKQSRFDLDGLISNTDSSIISKELGLDKEIAETASSDAMKMATSGYRTFLDAPKNYYTINIATKNGMSAASKYIRDNNLGDNAYSFEFGPSMRSAKILYGVYSSVEEAKVAMRSLSSVVLANKPYIDNIRKHQALYSKYN